jgi:hypothetical protein
MTKRKCRKVQTMIYKIYTGLNYVYLKWSPGLPNFGGFFGDQNLNLVNSGWQPEILIICTNKRNIKQIKP